MDLFSNLQEPTSKILEETITQIENITWIEYNPLQSLTDDFDVHAQFELALQQHDRQALNFLLSEEQVTLDWENKRDFIYKYAGWCEKMEKKQAIFITTLRGDCQRGGCGFNYCRGVTVSVNTVYNNKPIWQFNLLYRLDKEDKIVMRKCKRFDVDITQAP